MNKKNLVQRIALYLMAAIYILAGINHFRAPEFYLRMMPPYIPNHELMILLSGVAEVLLGVLLLFGRTRKLASLGIIAMLIVFFTVHIYMLQERHTVFADIPEAILWIRIPLQFVLIYWAYWVGKPRVDLAARKLKKPQ